MTSNLHKGYWLCFYIMLLLRNSREQLFLQMNYYYRDQLSPLHLPLKVTLDYITEWHSTLENVYINGGFYSYFKFSVTQHLKVPDSQPSMTGVCKLQPVS